MLEDGQEPLAVGRRKRRGTKAQRRALLRRDGGCARPGCPETRIERLHAHHLRHWLFGGRTDIANMALLCDVDHGLSHDLDLVMSRCDGRLVVTTPDGVRVWGGANAAFATGRKETAPGPTRSGEPYAGVHPIDETIGRRPAEAHEPDRERRQPTSATREIRARHSTDRRPRCATGPFPGRGPAAPRARAGGDPGVAPLPLSRPPRSGRAAGSVASCSRTAPPRCPQRRRRPTSASTWRTRSASFMGNHDLVRRRSAEAEDPLSEGP